MTPSAHCATAVDACLPATHDLRRFHGGCHHGPDGWQRLSQEYMRTTCFTRRGLMSTGLEECHVQRSGRRKLQEGGCA